MATFYVIKDLNTNKFITSARYGGTFGAKPHLFDNQEHAEQVMTQIVKRLDWDVTRTTDSIQGVEKAVKQQTRGVTKAEDEVAAAKQIGNAKIVKMAEKELAEKQKSLGFEQERITNLVRSLSRATKLAENTKLKVFPVEMP